MINNEIINNVKKEIKEDTIMVSYKIDIDVPPFMCSPFSEEWIWSKRTLDLNKYIYEILIPEYLIDSVSVYNDDLIEDKQYSFDEAIELFKKSDKFSETMLKNISVLKDMYIMYRSLEITYVEFIKMLIKLEELLNSIGILFEFISYANPYEARTSNMLKTDKFDYINLQNNF